MPVSFQYRHVYLFASLLALISLSPFIERQLVRVGVMDVFMIATMATAVNGVTSGRRSLRVVLLLGIGMTIALARQRLSGIESAMFPATALAFFGYVTFLLARDVFSDNRKVTADTICGALSVYLLVGVLFTFAFALLEGLQPGSFIFPEDPGRTGNHVQRLLGFSFITLTTLGYGNISPATHRADALCSLEAIVGQVYLTVLVARLVALQIIRHADDK